jgi:RHS repeat-associated protein
MAVEGSTTTYYAWDRGMTLAEYSPSGANALTWQKSFIYLGGRLLATESGAGTYQYHHPDRLGTRLITDSSGGIISEQVHLPYSTALSGESTNYGSSANPSKKRFTSYERSGGTKLDHAVNRQYHAGLGRFMQVDPIGMSAADISDPQSLNLYAYCGNDPINHTDPQGLFFKKLLKAIGKISGILKWIEIAIMIAVELLVAFGATGAALKILLFLNKHQWIGKLLNVGNKLGSFRTPGIFGGGSSGGVSNFVSGDDLEDGGPPIVVAIWVPGPWWDSIGKETVWLERALTNGVDPFKVKLTKGSANFNSCVGCFQLLTATFICAGFI